MVVVVGGGGGGCGSDVADVTGSGNFNGGEM